MILLVFFALFSCAREIHYLPDTEVACSNGYVYIVKFVKKTDVEKAIKNAYISKKVEKTSEQYTMLKFPDERSLRLEKLSPEDAVNCKLRETDYQAVDSIYLYGD